MVQIYDITNPVLDSLEHDGVAIRAFGENSGRSADDVAEFVGIDPERMKALERRAEAMATNAEVDALAAVLGVPRDSLFDD